MSPWATTTVQDIQLTGTMMRRALQRKVHADGPTSWIIDGDPRLSDQQAAYHVTLEDEVYECSCFSTRHGDVRRRKGCSHVAAVVLWRKREAAKALLNPPEPDLDIPGRDDPRFGKPAFPEWFQGFRRHQWIATEAVMQAYADGARVVFLQAATGTGKSLLGETVGRMVGGKTLYVCTTKTLQHQFAKDFPYGAVLKGKANYLTRAGAVDSWGRSTSGSSTITCADCTSNGGEDAECKWCPSVPSCPYRMARKTAEASRLAILNTAYFLTDANLGGRFFVDRDLCIADEADLLEGEVLNQVEVHISRRRAVALHIPPPPRKTVEATWAPWIEEEAIPRVEKRLEDLPPFRHGDVRQNRERRSLLQLLERLRIVAVEIQQGGWVYDGYDLGDITFRPIKVDRWGQHMLWPHAQRFLLMSASIISDGELANSLGLEGDYRMIDVPMTFPASNRPINVVALAEMSHKNREVAWPKMVQGVAGVLALHPEDRVLVHTVSYPFAEHLVKELTPLTDRPLITYREARERDAALEAYRLKPNAVLLAPSMDRGVDLPGDLCRVQVITKVPFPNLGDKRTAQRLHTAGGQSWYEVQTVRSIVQMTGRGVRGPDDYATTYILDHQFTTNLWRRSKRLLPEWWCDAVDWRFPVRRLLSAASESRS